MEKDLRTTYMGLDLKNPIIAGSTGLTGDIENLKNLEEEGVAAVVLKSIFEEEIFLEHEALLNQDDPFGSKREQLDYMDMQIRKENINKYVNLIKQAKKELSIPVIASINCAYTTGWLSFSKKLEIAGADAIELNMFFSPSDIKRNSADIEKLYFDVINRVGSSVTIPISLKISYHFTALGNTIMKLSESGIKGMVLFNRFFSPDIDIDTMSVKPSFVLSDPSEIGKSLRWVALFSERAGCDICASTGIHSGDAVIKQLLAGAKAVQVASALYDKRSGIVKDMLNKVESWMISKSFTSIDDFRGRLAVKKDDDPALYERSQFMKYYTK
jgi:dihydroorotate dehydrogenase (fumarate)